MFASLMTSRRFAPLFWCQLCSALNDNFLKNALGMLILFGLGGVGATSGESAGTLIALSGIVFIAPFFILSALGGELADRYDKAFVAQRIRLASQIGSGLVGTLYVLDEPSIGLHQRDNRRLIDTLLRLRDLGNTVLVVEHDEEAIRAADAVLDIGPGAGVHGGHIVAQGTPAEILANANSLTGKYLSGRMQIALPRLRTPRDPKRNIRVVGARGNNLKNVSADFPLGLFTCVTGVSGERASTCVIRAASRRGVANPVSALSGARNPRWASASRRLAANVSPRLRSALGGSSSVKSSTTSVADELITRPRARLRAASGTRVPRATRRMRWRRGATACGCVRCTPRARSPRSRRAHRAG